MDIEATNELSLLKAYRGGDRAAIERLYLRYRDRVFAYLMTLSGSREEAEELLHDVFCTLMARGRSERILNLSSYLFRSARNAALNARSQRKRRESRDIAFLTRAETTDSGSAVSSAELHEAIYSLPAEQREAVVLKIWGEITFETMAEVTGVPLGTAMSRYRMGLDKLRKALVR